MLPPLISSQSTEKSSSFIKMVFEKLKPEERIVSLLFDEIYVMPSIRLRKGHMYGYSLDQPSKPARTILAIMIKFFDDKQPAFISKLYPVFSLKPCFLINCLKENIAIIQQLGGRILTLLCDNHPTNREAYLQFAADSNLIVKKGL